MHPYGSPVVTGLSDETVVLSDEKGDMGMPVQARLSPRPDLSAEQRTAMSKIMSWSPGYAQQQQQQQQAQQVALLQQQQQRQLQQGAQRTCACASLGAVAGVVEVSGEASSIWEVESSMAAPVALGSVLPGASNTRSGAPIRSRVCGTLEGTLKEQSGGPVGDEIADDSGVETVSENDRDRERESRL